MKRPLNHLPQAPWTAAGLWSFERHAFIILLISLSIVGIGEGLLLTASLGSAPWTILAQGISLQGGFSVGWASRLISLLVMLLWFPLKLQPGIGTVMNIVVISIFLGLTTSLLSTPAELYLRISYAIGGIILFGLGAAFYLTCHQGAGPRDGLMVGLCYRFNWKIGIVRTTIEVSVCILGFAMGGTVGIGTLLFAFSIGWVIQWTLLAIYYRYAKENDKTD